MAVPVFLPQEHVIISNASLLLRARKILNSGYALHAGRNLGRTVRRYAENLNLVRTDGQLYEAEDSDVRNTEALDRDEENWLGPLLDGFNGNCASEWVLKSRYHKALPKIQVQFLGYEFEESRETFIRLDYKSFSIWSGSRSEAKSIVDLEGLKPEQVAEINDRSRLINWPKRPHETSNRYDATWEWKIGIGWWNASTPIPEHPGKTQLEQIWPEMAVTLRIYQRLAEKFETFIRKSPITSTSRKRR